MHEVGAHLSRVVYACIARISLRASGPTSASICCTTTYHAPG